MRLPVRMRENTRPTADTTIVGGSCERVSLVPGSPTIVAFRLFGTQVFTGVPMVIIEGFSGYLRGSDFTFSRVENEAGERQCVKRPAGFTADGRADRISSRFDRICSLFRAYR